MLNLSQATKVFKNVFKKNNPRRIFSVFHYSILFLDNLLDFFLYVRGISVESFSAHFFINHAAPPENESGN